MSKVQTALAFIVLSGVTLVWSVILPMIGISYLMGWLT